MSPQGQYHFHSGVVFAKSGGANPTPRQVGTVQEVSVDFKASNKELTGENVFAEAVGRGSVKVSGKIKQGKFQGSLLNDIFFNAPTTAQANLLALEEAATVATGTVTVTNGANMVEDLGVKNASTGESYTRVSTSPAAKQYTVNETTGVYTFNVSENGNGLLFSYLYKSVAAGAKTLSVQNQPTGLAPTLKLILNNRFQGKNLTMILYAIVAESLALGWKNEDFMMPDIAFMCQADSLGRVVDLSAEVFG